MWIKLENSLTYQETLKLIEKLMTDSGIREYCTEICKGSCCAACYKSKDACHFNEGRRLVCSAFVCGALKNLLCKDVKEDLHHIQNIIEEQYSKYQGLTQTTGNAYFTAPDKVFLEIVRFPHYLKAEIGIINTEKIKKVISKLIKEKRKIR